MELQVRRGIFYPWEDMDTKGFEVSKNVYGFSKFQRKYLFLKHVLDKIVEKYVKDPQIILK